LYLGEIQRATGHDDFFKMWLFGNNASQTMSLNALEMQWVIHNFGWDKNFLALGRRDGV
jgi:hypothetical protein